MVCDLYSHKRLRTEREKAAYASTLAIITNNRYIMARTDLELGGTSQRQLPRRAGRAVSDITVSASLDSCSITYEVQMTIDL